MNYLEKPFWLLHKVRLLLNLNKMKNLSPIILCVALFVLSCSGSSTKIKAEKKDAVQIKIKIFEAGCKCASDNKLIVRTEYIDVPDSINEFGIIIIKQSLIFENEDTIVQTLYPPFRKKVLLLNEEKIEVPLTSVSNIKCLHNGNDWIYKIYGSNEFDPPHEFFALSSLDGEWLSYYYGSKDEIYEKHSDEEKYIDQFGKENITSLKNMIRVIPIGDNSVH